MNLVPKYGRILCGALLAALACATVRAQDDNPGGLTNAVLEAAEGIASNALATIAEFVQTNEVASNELSQADELTKGTNWVEDTNSAPLASGGGQPGPRESRRQWLLRQRVGAQGTNEPGKPNDSSQTNGSAYASSRPAKPSFSTFRIVTDRNIFDPNRVARRIPRSQQPSPKATDSFSLVGLMSYEKGTFAFFDGSRSEYRKALKRADEIAGYKVAGVTPEAVQLVSGTNSVELRVGMQLRRGEEGNWTRVEQPEPNFGSANSASASLSASASATSGTSADNDVLERLRKKREQE